MVLLVDTFCTHIRRHILVVLLALLVWGMDWTSALLMFKSEEEVLFFFADS